MLRSITRYATTLSWCKACKLYLAFSFLFGFAVGVLLSGTVGPSGILLMRRLCTTPVSIVRLLIVRSLPFLITALVLYKFSSRLFLPLAFGKAFLYGYTLRLIYLAFPGAGWFVWLMLLFSDTIATLALYSIWLQNLSAPTGDRFRRFIWYLGAVLVISVFDYCVLSPYLAMLIKG